MPVLVDGELTPSLLIAALEVLRADGLAGEDDDDQPEQPMTLAELFDWFRLHVRAAPGQRARYHMPAGRPGRRRTEQTVHIAP